MTFPQKLTIEVTAADIRSGRVSDCRHCPIAIAALRATGAADVLVRSVGCEFVENGKTVADYGVPKEARDFMASFDSGQPANPITFQMERRA